MNYTINPKFWLRTEADRIEGLLTLPANWSKTYTPASLQAELQEQGLSYSVAQCQLILDELVIRKVVGGA